MIYATFYLYYCDSRDKSEGYIHIIAVLLKFIKYVFVSQLIYKKSVVGYAICKAKRLVFAAV